MDPAIVSQPIHPLPYQQHQSNQEPLPWPRPNDQSNEQPSMICGFTLSELAHATIQVAGVILAAIFGAWAVKSYESANIANRLSEGSLSQSNAANRLAQDALEQSLYANILAILNLCISEQFSSSIDCSAVIQAAPFASIIHGVIPSLPTTRPSTSPPLTTASTTASTITSTLMTPTATTTITLTNAPAAAPSASGIQLGFGAIVGIIIAAVITIAIVCLLLIRHRRGKRSRL